ncbi:hypothetical protein N7488_000311 [Penicillium malachiteum]|nr:hypothetical protein N7488_000311 [Penicillium malachiteum]
MAGAGKGRHFTKASSMLMSIMVLKKKSLSLEDLSKEMTFLLVIWLNSMQMPYLTKAITEQSTKEREGSEDSSNLIIFEANLPPEPCSALHQPMTLDQFYYLFLMNSKTRDTDQVILRWAENMD